MEVQLDFAYWHLLPAVRGGPAFGMKMPSWLAPLFLAPRVERLLRFEGIGAQGAEVLLPLRADEWCGLPPERRWLLWNRGAALLSGHDLPLRAVDRRLRGIVAAENAGAVSSAVTFGDDFILALALLRTEQALTTAGARSIVVVAAEEVELPYLLLRLHSFGLPLALQSSCPLRQESMIYRLLYHHGAAISNHLIDPCRWEREALILQFGGPAMPASPRYIRLADDCTGLAPALEAPLRAAGLSGALAELAPIMEACLYDRNAAGAPPRPAPDHLLQRGAESGIWQAFLDNQR